MSIRGKLSRIGISVGVLAASIAVFVAAFFGLQMYADSQKPPQTEVLATTSRLQIGDVIRSNDLQTITVFDDQATEAFLPASAITNTVGGIVRMPVDAGQPLLQQTVLARSTAQTRLASVLSDRPGMSLMPLPLDQNNIVAPPLDAYLPGDYVDVTIVVGRQPQRINQQQDESGPGETGQTEAASQPVANEPVADQFEELRSEPLVAESLERLRPPMAKSLFPQGARIMSVYGRPPEPAANEDSENEDGRSNVVLPQTAGAQDPLLVLMVPSEQRERLSLAMQRGDLVVVSLLGQTDEEPERTPGFTYDDLEEWLKIQRLETFEEQISGDVEDGNGLFSVEDAERDVSDGSSSDSTITGTNTLTDTTPAASEPEDGASNDTSETAAGGSAN